MSVLAPGLLLAAPRLGDPNFVKSVVLLGHHDEEGALGWVLNGKALGPVSRLLTDADLVPPGTSLPESTSYAGIVRVGGPVMPGSAWILFERPDGHTPWDPEHDLRDGHAVTGAREAVEALARGTAPARFRLILGYAGWGAGQLEGEIREGAWLPTQVDPTLLFDTPPDALWDSAYQVSLGTTPMAFTSTVRGQA
ncbi:MAG: YqgE/AlgH family protein [Polyangiaceae bacterium]|nr:YqgE/AlgH family protein [Polyangiaceae bacterium]